MSKIMDKVICKFENDGYSEIDIPRLLNISPLEFDRYKEDAKCVRIKDALYISELLDKSSLAIVSAIIFAFIISIIFKAKK